MTPWRTLQQVYPSDGSSGGGEGGGHQEYPYPAGGEGGGSEVDPGRGEKMPFPSAATQIAVKSVRPLGGIRHEGEGGCPVPPVYYQRDTHQRSKNHEIGVNLIEIRRSVKIEKRVLFLSENSHKVEKGGRFWTSTYLFVRGESLFFLTYWCFCIC